MSTTPTTCQHCGIPDKMECISWQGSRRSTCFKRQIAALKAELEQAKAGIDESATNLRSTVVDRNRIGVQLDLIRDELKRIEARILESKFSHDPHLSNILDYCRRSQSDIATSYSVIGERDRLEAVNSRLTIELDDTRSALKKANKLLHDFKVEERPHGSDRFGNACECDHCQAWDQLDRTIAAITAALEAQP